MSVPSRGVRDIRTLSGRVDMVALPYRAYMRISCLEMERFRRDQEKAGAMHRMDILNGRIQEIEVEKDTLLQGLGERGADRPRGRRVTPSSAMRPGANANGFKLKY
jgi:hypothetical protein